MGIDSFRALCLSLPETVADFPFDEETLVFKVAGKMFALTNVSDFESVNLKVDPEERESLMEAYSAVKPGYHMNKKHWITVYIDGDVPDSTLSVWVQRSYKLVVAKLSKTDRLRLKY